MSQRRNQTGPTIKALLCCLVYLSVANCCFKWAQAKSIEADSLKLPSNSLVQLSDMIRQGNRPSVELVFDAYDDYIRLHQIQSGQLAAGGAKAALSENEEEARRIKISEILEEPFVKIISENLFQLLPDENTDGEFDKSPRLNRIITRAINGLGLQPQ